MSETVTLSRKQYQTLMGYKQIVELEYDKPLSKTVLKKLALAQRDIQVGRGVVLHSKQAVKNYLEGL